MDVAERPLVTGIEGPGDTAIWVISIARLHMMFGCLLKNEETYCSQAKGIMPFEKFKS